MPPTEIKVHQAKSNRERGQNPLTPTKKAQNWNADSFGTSVVPLQALAAGNLTAPEAGISAVSAQ